MSFWKGAAADSTSESQQIRLDDIWDTQQIQGKDHPLNKKVNLIINHFIISSYFHLLSSFNDLIMKPGSVEISGMSTIYHLCLLCVMFFFFNFQEQEIFRLVAQKCNNTILHYKNHIPILTWEEPLRLTKSMPSERVAKIMQISAVHTTSVKQSI